MAVAGRPARRPRPDGRRPDRPRIDRPLRHRPRLHAQQGPPARRGALSPAAVAGASRQGQQCGRARVPGESDRHALASSKALTSPYDADVELGAGLPGSPADHRCRGASRFVATGIARMPGSGAQVRALDTLARHRLSDSQSLNELARLFPAASSVDVQRAIAAVLIRADYAVDRQARSRARAEPESPQIAGRHRYHRHPHPSPPGAGANSEGATVNAMKILGIVLIAGGILASGVWRIYLHEGNPRDQDRTHHAVGHATRSE